MSELQLQNLKQKIGPGNVPKLDQNGRLLYMYDSIGGYLEFLVVTYNLTVLGDMINKNMEKRKKLDELVDNYVKKLETRCPGTPIPSPPPSAPFRVPSCPFSLPPSNIDPNVIRMLWMMMNQCT